MQPSARRWADRLGHHLAGVLAWWLPPECLLCLTAVPTREGDALICASCRRKWRPVAPPWCPRCGETLEGGGVTGGREDCSPCRDWGPALASVRSAVWLERGAREAVHHLKYGGWKRAVEAMAATMTGLEPLAAGAGLVPVPLGPRRRRARGYNQAELLASRLADVTGLQVLPGLLARVRDTPTQTKLTPGARRANVHGAFALRGPLPAGPLVLVDDVFTTGATLLAAAEALREAGAPRVEAVTFARGTGPLPRT
jgi:ComF family protein